MHCSRPAATTRTILGFRVITSDLPLPMLSAAGENGLVGV